jgi:hypothetical protein
MARRLLRYSAAAMICAASLTLPIAAQAQGPGPTLPQPGTHRALVRVDSKAAPRRETERCAAIGDPVVQAECIARFDALRPKP